MKWKMCSHLHLEAFPQCQIRSGLIAVKSKQDIFKIGLLSDRPFMVNFLNAFGSLWRTV